MYGGLKGRFKEPITRPPMVHPGLRPSLTESALQAEIQGAAIRTSINLVTNDYSAINPNT